MISLLFSLFFDSKEGRLHFFNNTWTGTTEPFQHTLQAYYHAMEHLSLALLQILELSLSLPSGYFTEHMHRHTSILTANHYPILLSDVNPTLLSPHPVQTNTDMTDNSIAIAVAIDDFEQTTAAAAADYIGDTDMEKILSHPTDNSSFSSAQLEILIPPPIPQVRVAEHTDVSMLTIVSSSAPGLEIYEKDSATYQPVAHIKGALIMHENQTL
jgi:isopenicillin N synthase-like dioxygenase